MIKKITGIFLLVMVLSVSLACSEIDTERQQKIDFGHVMGVVNIETDPAVITPGQGGVIKIKLQNNANFILYDLRVDLTLPGTVSFLDDVSRKKMTLMSPGEIKEVEYQVIALPAAAENVYVSNFSVVYSNHVGTERTESYNFGIVIGGVPGLYSIVEDTTIYKGSKMGEVTIRFVNNNIADIKFLTVELEESEDFKILSEKKKYIGDLDSDDFESVDFKIELKKTKEEVLLPLKVSYKDSTNKDYLESIEDTLYVRSAKELGVESSGKLVSLIVILVIVFGVYFIYKRYRKKKRI